MTGSEIDGLGSANCSVRMNRIFFANLPLRISVCESPLCETILITSEAVQQFSKLSSLILRDDIDPSGMIMYVRHIDPSVLAFSLSSHRPPHVFPVALTLSVFHN